MPHFPPPLQLPRAELVGAGRSFSSGGQTGSTSISTLNEDETAAVFLPPSLFQSIGTSVGIFFAVYNTGALFPITNATRQVQGKNASITTVVGSPVLAVTVGSGLNFSNLPEPVRILLRLIEMEVRDRDACVFNFSACFDWQEWSHCVKVQLMTFIMSNCTPCTERYRSTT